MFGETFIHVLIEYLYLLWASERHQNKYNKHTKCLVHHYYVFYYLPTFLTIIKNGLPFISTAKLHRMECHLIVPTVGAFLFNLDSHANHVNHTKWLLCRIVICAHSQLHPSPSLRLFVVFSIFSLLASMGVTWDCSLLPLLLFQNLSYNKHKSKIAGNSSK